jgi:hypothetical protein
VLRSIQVVCLHLNRYAQRVEHSDDIQPLYPTPVLLRGAALFKDALSQWVPNRKGGGPDVLTGQISSFRLFSTFNRIFP